MALDHDFYLTSGATSLGFNKKITAETPEERATAQFRKEQFDSQGSVGDQSLTGWWTRGQLSFHKGAGITYYEVSEQGTLNRFDTGNNVAAVPGELSLAPLRSASSVTAMKDAVPISLAGGGGVFTISSSGAGNFVNIGSATNVPTSTGGSPTDITSDGEKFYWVNGAKIERQSGSTTPRTNYVTNPSFETSTTGWTLSGGASWSRTTLVAKYGTRSLNSDSGAATTAEIYAETTVTGLTAGNTYYVSGWAASSTPVDLLVDGSTLATVTPGASMTQLSSTFVASATSATVRFRKPVGANGYGFALDAVLVTETPWAGDYFDGSTPGASWNGTANASTSTWATSATTATTVLVTSTDSTWSKVFFAKGRLFAVDAGGRWYSAARGVTTSTVVGDAFWASGTTGVSWRLADGPAAVYASDGTQVFAITVDAAGRVPVLSAPTTVTQVPSGERITAMTYYLGFLVLTTTAGVRLALVEDNGGLRLGPLVVEGDFTASRRIGAYGNYVFAVGKTAGSDQTLFRLDLSETVEGAPLVCPFEPRGVLSTGASVNSGAVVDGTGRVWAWAGGTLWFEDVEILSTTGWVRTGFHRFGSLDSKFFAQVVVRTAGAGAVTVSTVGADGTATAVGSCKAADGVTQLALASSGERLRLLFELARDGSDSASGPVLLGYQLRALPVPERQRMKRVPLALFDRESNRNGQQMGNDGSAWTRLQALEALEESNAVVNFEDKETGETGSAYIESVEMRRTAPTSRHSDGFGGTVWVTLRVI